MSRYAPDALVTVFPFTRQPEGDEIVIGRPQTAAFVSLTPDAVALLDVLAAGKTVREAQLYYQAHYGELPDLEDFLTVLEDKGFVTSTADADSHTGNAGGGQSAIPKPVRFHLEHFPVSLARRLFGPTALVIYGGVLLMALAVAIMDPATMPSRTALFFPENMTAMRLTLMALGVVMVMIHELAHLVAARAAGVSARFGIGHRLWVLVAETDMTGVWSLPRQQRYWPLLAGPIADALGAAVLVFLRYAEQHHWVTFSPPVSRLVQALLFSYLMQLLWQCYLFVQTDFYYVISNYFQCKNLIGDTEDLLRNLVGKLFRRVNPKDLSYIPAAEMRVIRWYAVVWVLGRAVALLVLFGVMLPVLWLYVNRVVGIFRAGYVANSHAFVDALLLGSIVLLQQGAGFVLWIRSLLTKRRHP